MIFFDIDGTLMDHELAEAAGARAFRAEHPAFSALSNEHFVARWHNLAEKHMDRYLAGEVDYRGQRRDRLIELFGAVGKSIAPGEADVAFDRYLLHYEANWRLFDDALPCLDALAGRELGVISNGAGTAQRRKLEKLGIAARFAVIALSGELGHAKPDPRIFAWACARAGRDPASCVYVGDRDHTDALAAEAAGLVGIHLDRRAEGSDATTRIAGLAELPDLLPLAIPAAAAQHGP